MPAPLADRALWVYAGGLAVIASLRLLPRSVPLPSGARTGTVAVVLTGMVLAYAAERYHAGQAGIDSPPLVGIGAVGVGVGGAVALAGGVAGPLFLAGGLAFLYRGLGGERS